MGNISRKLLSVGMSAMLLGSLAVMANAETDAEVYDDTYSETVAADGEMVEETAETVGEEEESGMSENLAYLLKGAIVIGVGIVLYIIVAKRSSN